MTRVAERRATRCGQPPPMASRAACAPGHGIDYREPAAVALWGLAMKRFQRSRRAALGWGAAALVGLPARAQPPNRLALATGAHPPIVSVPGRPGFAEELVRDALRHIGYELEVVPLPPERALLNANDGVEDGDLFRAAGFERDYPNLVRVPEALIEDEYVAFSTRPDVVVRQWADLDRYAVAYITGYKIFEREVRDVGNVTLVRNGELLVKLLASGRADVILDERWLGLYGARSAGLAVRVQAPPLATVPMFLYLHRRHESLVGRIAAALAETRRDGRWQRLYDQTLKTLEPAR
jgi:polar amino acid transport system substrate-binding protein